jgi:DNA-binding transcriptional MerR regulator
MLISEFSRATGLTPDTVRFYIRRGLLTPGTGGKGGSNPYQVFTQEHVDTARMIRLCQSLGFTLREIAALNDEYRKEGISKARAREIFEAQMTRLQEKSAQLDMVMAYMRAKLAWIESGGKGAEPAFGDYELGSRRPNSRRAA